MMEKLDEFILLNLFCQKEGDSFNQASVEHLVSVYRQAQRHIGHRSPSVINKPHRFLHSKLASGMEIKMLGNFGKPYLINLILLKKKNLLKGGMVV